jgi:hypothetical protein
MIKLSKDGEIVHTININEPDPLTLETYKQILEDHRRENKDMVLCMLICENHRPVYLACYINTLRFGDVRNNQVFMRYELIDPISRVKVNQLWYFVADKYALENGCNARFLCDEVELISNPVYQSIVFDLAPYETDNTCRGCLIVMGCLVGFLLLHFFVYLFLTYALSKRK